MVDHLVQADDDDLPLACLEDLAIASVAAPLLPEATRPDSTAWCGVVARWQALSQACAPIFRPLRLQPLFFRTLEVLRADCVETLGRWEVLVLLEAVELARPLGHGGTALFRDAMLPYMKDLQMLAEHHGPLFDLNTIRLDVDFITSKDIAGCRAREVKSVAGIEVGFVGPLMSHTASVKVLDSIPDNSALVVDGGSCFINGYVFGRVIASDACHVGRSISGKVVVRQGNITAESVLRRGFVVTKNGTVELRMAEAPELVFGGSGVEISDRAVMGVYAAPRIRVGKEANGGVYGVSDTLSAPLFRCSPDRPLSVFLQRATMPEDYGELLGQDARKLTVQCMKVRQQLMAYERLIAVAEDDIERTAASAISYLLGGEVVRKEVEAVRQAERRLLFLNRLIAGLDILNESMETNSGAEADSDAENEVESGWDEVIASWDDSDETREPEWIQEEQELAQLGQLLGRKKLEVRTQDNLFRWNEKKFDWVRERNTLLGTIERKRAELKRLMGRVETVGSLDLNLSKQRQLAILLESLRDRNAKEDWAERATTPFMRVLLRNIASLRNRANHYSQTVPGFRDQLKALSEKLRDEFSIHLNLDDTRMPPQVTGCFEEGVQIHPRRFRERANPDDGFVTTEASTEICRTYVRAGSSIEELCTASPPTD